MNQLLTIVPNLGRDALAVVAVAVAENVREKVGAYLAPSLVPTLACPWRDYPCRPSQMQEQPKGHSS